MSETENILEEKLAAISSEAKKIGKFAETVNDEDLRKRLFRHLGHIHMSLGEIHLYLAGATEAQRTIEVNRR